MANHAHYTGSWRTAQSQMKDNADYYQLLLVHPDAPLEIIRASYRTIMQSLRQHPDLGGDHERATLINQAYAVLTDPEKRAAYDLARAPDADEGAAEWEEKECSTSECAGSCGFCSAPYDIGRALHADDLCASCMSPLYPAERHRHENSGQRMLSRIKKRQVVSCYTSWPQTGIRAEMRDLSLNGMQLHAPFAADPGQLIKVHCESCQAVVRVAYCRSDGATRWRLGVEFVTLQFASTRGNFVSARA